ncbi:MAG: radical SAM/SPASM domain-containing protein [Candidatus Pacearchaeota archaeon]
MYLSYLVKEAKYYRNLGKGHLRRMLIKFLLAKTPLSFTVNSSFYNLFYNSLIKNKGKKLNPSILQIENTNICNARCIMCPHIYMKRKQKIMKQEQFVKICKNVLPYSKINLITLTGFGEPLIDKELDKKVKWINENYPSIDIDIYTNASLLNSEVTERLLKLRLHKINFSINGTEKTYKKIMGLEYERTKKNILNFLKRKKELKKIYPLTNISLMILKENKKEINKVIDFWEDKVDSVMAYTASDWAGQLKNKRIIIKPSFKNKRWPCIALWKNITVDVEGNVIICCRDYESKVKFGNLLKDNYREIEKKIKIIRNKHLKNDFSIPLCNNCDNSFDSSLDWW